MLSLLQLSLPFFLCLELYFLFIWAVVIQRPPQAINPAGQRQTEIGKHYSPVQWTRQFWSRQYVIYIYIYFFFFFLFKSQCGLFTRKGQEQQTISLYSNSHSEQALGNRLEIVNRNRITHDLMTTVKLWIEPGRKLLLKSFLAPYIWILQDKIQENVYFWSTKWAAGREVIFLCFSDYLLNLLEWFK